MFAKFDEILSKIFQDIKETKRYGHTFSRTVVRSVGRSDNVKTVYPPTNTVCGGYNYHAAVVLIIQAPISGPESDPFVGDRRRHPSLPFQIWPCQ